MTSNDPTTLRRLIAYFRDCMLADGGERQIRDVFGRDETDHHLFAVDPTQTAPSPYIPIPREVAKRIIARLRMQRQERELMGGMYLVRAQPSAPGEPAKAIRAPLLLFGAQLLEQTGEYAVRLEPDTVRLNPVVVDALGLAPPEELDLVKGRELLARFERKAHVGTRREMPRWRAGQEPYWMASGMVWVTRRSEMARSVAYELDSLCADDSDLSEPLKRILGGAPRSAGDGDANPPQPETLPTRLTGAQEQTLHNAARETLSVVNGPPGTGKTYVLACQAIDRVMRNERVLIVCGNENAADVVRGKLGALFGAADGLLVRAGRGDHRRELLKRLDDLLSEGPSYAEPEPPDALEAQLQEAATAYRRREEQFRRALAQSVSDGEILRGNSRWLWAVLHRWLVRRRVQKKPLLLSACWAELQASVKGHQERASNYLLGLSNHNRRLLLQRKRRQLAALVKALRSRVSGYRQERFEALDWEVLTQAFPVWVVSAQALYRVLPLQKELFDLVILDEATQCSLPLALPALQRARRAVIVGDPKQLRHFSFVSRDRQRQLASRYEVEESSLDLDYRERSLLDYGLAAVSGSHAIGFLDEHFRSHPELISFSNKTFYRNRLKVLTRLKPGSDESPLELERCQVDVVDGVNEAEIAAVITKLKSLVDEYRQLPEGECPQIGVLAFFQATAVRLEQELLNAFDLAMMSRHEIRVGTPYAFQGEERDIMLLATGLYPGRSAAAWNYINRADVFNVAVTRARNRQIVFLPEGALESSGANLLRDYLEHARDDRAERQARPRTEADTLRSELIDELRRWGATCHLDYPFAGKHLDLLVQHRGQAVAVDTIGSSIPAGEAWEWERYRQLERAGLTLFPVSYAAWRLRREDVVRELERILGEVSVPAHSGASKKYQALRWRLDELGDSDSAARIDALEKAYANALHWLQLRFEPTELTYLRYRQGIEQLHAAAFSELQGAVLLLEGLRDISPDSITGALRSELELRIEGGERATAALEHLGEELALLRTSESGLEQALSEIRMLAERVQRYGIGAEEGDAPEPTRQTTTPAASEEQTKA